MGSLNGSNESHKRQKQLLKRPLLERLRRHSDVKHLTDKACSKCNRIATDNVCPKCRTPTMSDDFAGLVIVLDPKNSAIAKVMKIEDEGRYALKVR